MTTPLHISGIRVAHGHAEREVQTARAPSVEGPIAWSTLTREPDGKVRTGQGNSGLSYRVKQGQQWVVTVSGSRGRELLVGSARLQDHALALAGMWEQAVANGRVDVE